MSENKPLEGFQIINLKRLNLNKIYYIRVRKGTFYIPAACSYIFEKCSRADVYYNSKSQTYALTVAEKGVIHINKVSTGNGRLFTSKKLVNFIKSKLGQKEIIKMQCWCENEVLYFKVE